MDMTIRSAQQTRDKRCRSRALAQNEGLRMVVAEDRIHFIGLGLGDTGDPTSDLVGLTFFNKCLGRVTDSFLATADNVMMMSNEGPTAGEPLAAAPDCSKTGAKGRPRLRGTLVAHTIGPRER